MNKPKIVVVGTEAREKLIKGANLLADAVKSTHGPFGMNAVIGLKGNVDITNDGVRIANDIWSADEIENLGIRTIREAAQKTNDKAGDGTTTATIIAQAALKTLSPLLQSGNTFKAAKPAIALSKQFIKESEEVIEKLIATPVTSKEDLINVARVSVEDEAMAELIGGTQWELGPDGSILAEESNDVTDSIERIRGVRIDNGFGTSLVLNNLEKQSLDLTNVRVILTNHNLVGNKALHPLKDVLEPLAKQGVTDVAIIARSFSNEAIQLCMENHKTGFRIYPINAPYVDQVQVMLDLAAVTGAKFINAEERNLESMMVSDVGLAEKISASRFSAIITGNKDEHTDEMVEKRIKELEQNIIGSQSDFEIKGIQERLSQLKNGFALLKVGGNSLVERKYKYDKAVDCVNATKLALQHGTVKGGGLALKEIADELPDTYLIKRALMAPYEQIQANAGEKLEIPDWCRDPYFVVKTALTHAISVAAQLATASIAIDWENDKPKYVQEATREE